MKSMKIPLWIKIENDIIVDSYKSTTEQRGYIKIPWNSDVKIGDNKNWYNEIWKRIPDNELVKMKIRIDNRGWYWDITDFQKSLQIISFDIPIPKGFTNKPPIGNKPCIWMNEQWVINESTIKEKNILIELDEIDKKSGAGRSVRKTAIDMGEMLSIVREVAMDFANMAEQLQVSGFEPSENEALRQLIGFDPAENEDLQRITEWENKAKELREELSELKTGQIEEVKK